MAQRGEQYRRYLRQIASPAAGGEIDVTPNGMGGWRIQALIFTLTSSAAVGARIPQLTADDGTTVWWRSPAVTEIHPSSTDIFIAHPGIVGSGAAPGGLTRQASAVFAAAAAGSAALQAGESITGFTLNFQGAAAATNMDVTITNVLGGTITYRIVNPVLGKDLHILFPDPIPAATGLVAPTVTVPATVGGPAGSVTVYGRRAQAANVTSQAWPDEGLILSQGWHLRTITANIDVADQYSAIAVVVEELASGPDYAVRPEQSVNISPLDS